MELWPEFLEETSFQAISKTLLPHTGHLIGCGKYIDHAKNMLDYAEI